MDSDKFIHEIMAALGAVCQALAPAALGAAVAQAWKTGLSWTQRIVQWLVGICVSYYVTLALGATFRLDPFVAQAVGFVLAMVAFEATPKFIASCSNVVGTLPGDLYARWFGRKEDVE